VVEQFLQFVSTYEVQIVIGVIVTVAATIIIFLLRGVVRKVWELIFPPSGKEVRDKKLRLHFNELSEETKAILSEARISEMYGLVVTYAGGIPQYHPDFVGIELPKLPDSFEAHFPIESKMYGDYISRILRNNEGYKELRQKVRTDFESEGIPVVNINPPPKTSPVIYDTILWPLFSWWKDCNQGKAKPWPNFEQIETNVDFGPNHLVVAGWGSGAIAYAETDSDKQKCKYAIGKVAKNTEYESEAAETIDMANERVKEIRTFKEQLIDTLDDIGKFWPGTKKYKFREEKNCSRCKELFH